MKYALVFIVGLFVGAPIYAQAQDASDSALSCTTGVAASTSGLQIIGQPRIVQGPYGVTVNGRVQNPTTRSITGIITVTLFDQSGTIVGVYHAAMPAVAGGDEETYTALGSDNPASWAAVEAKVSQQF